MSFGRCDISLVKRDRRAGESGIYVSALAVQAFPRAERGENLVGIVVRFKMGRDVRLLPGVRRANRVGGGLGSLERVRHSKRDILAVIANDIILEWRTP